MVTVTDQQVDDRWTLTRRCGVSALLASVVAVAAWVYGMAGGAFPEPRPTGEYCTGGPLAFPATSWTWLPLSHVCRYADGTTRELVPAGANLVVDGCLMVVLCCAVVVIGAWAGPVSAVSRPSPGAGASPGR